ncbi:MAG: dihydropteroate synthase [Pseudomonadota bacterium]
MSAFYLSHLQAGQFQFALDTPLVMGIVNCTPDSFSGQSQSLQADQAIAIARQHVADGAHIIDIGGESTRPGAAPVSCHTEMQRVLPVLEALVADGVCVSIDTRHPEVMRAAIKLGASMINDVNALRAEDAIAAVCGSEVALCLMHMQGEPGHMQDAPFYLDVVAEVAGFLAERARACLRAGIAAHRIVLDPGFGFGKTHAHNVELMRQLSWLHQLGFPLLCAWSRKRSLGEITARPVEQRMAASIGAALASVAAGAAMVRVHDVAETVDALRVWKALRQTSPVAN